MLIEVLLTYKAWADRRTLDAVAQIDHATHPKAFTFARQQLNHMVRVEELFRARLSGAPDPHDSTNTNELPLLEELDRRIFASNHWLQIYAKALSPKQSVEKVRFTFVDGKSGMLTREEVMFHMVNHGTYHRGAIGHALDLAGASRPADTYTVFIHANEPDRRKA